MSLLKIHILILSTLLLVIMGGAFLVSVINSHTFLEHQLASHAEDTASSLGLLLSSPLAEQEIAGAESIVSAVFDRGYYQRVVITNMDGGVVVERKAPLVVKDVPGWFIRFLPMSAPSGEAVIHAGWRQVGKVLVRSHPGYAYAELWNSFIGIIYWFVGVWAAGNAVLILVLKMLNADLKAVEAQAAAIAARDFTLQEKTPFSQDLRRVFTTMNQMSRKLKSVFEDQARFIEILQRDARMDPVTGLFNRRHFEARLRHLCESPAEFFSGALLLVRIEGFREFNQRFGVPAGDEFLETAARAIEAVCTRESSQVLTAKMTGAEFAVYFPGIETEKAEALADAVIAGLTRLGNFADFQPKMAIHCGIAITSEGDSISRAFSAADTALRKAQYPGGSAWRRYQSDEAPGVLKADDLRAVLNKSLDTKSIEMELDPVVALDPPHLLHYEALARIRNDSGETLPAQAFILMAEKIGRIQELDRLVVERVLSLMTGHGGDADFAVNISIQSIKDPAFMDWLCDTLNTLPRLAERLFFETPEYSCTVFPDTVKSAIARIRKAGARFGLDHFGLSNGSFGYLIDLDVSYLKVDGSYFRGISQSKDNQFFIQAIGNIIHSLDVRLVGCCVETAEELEMVKALNVDAIQGSAATRIPPPPAL